MTERSQFVCPVCGSREWGSAYNFDGPGDDPRDAQAGPGLGVSPRTKQSRFEGTFTRLCHGRIGNQSCRYTWNSRDDAKHGIPTPSFKVEGQQAAQTGRGPPSVRLVR